MTEKEIISWVKYLYQKDRNVLLMALKDCGDFQYAFDSLTNQIQTGTNQPLRSCCCLSDGTLEWLGLPDREQVKKRNLPLFANDYDIGDTSFHFEILLNEGVNGFYDWDKRLISKCGGTVLFLDFRVNMLLPLYTYDMLYMKYNTKDKYYEWGPFRPNTELERNTFRSANNVMKNNGYVYISPKMARQEIRGIYTDLCNENKATLFDCLFTDLDDHTTRIKRLLDTSITVKGQHFRFSWEEYYDKNYKSIKKRIWLTFPSKDSESLHFDKKGRITDIYIKRHGVKYPHSDFEMHIDRMLKRRLKSGTSDNKSRGIMILNDSHNI